ncbi:MAG: DNA-processing protein DprA [bacterium]|nr:DNA-processing protein DprA [Candidatus Margulisiibacteriota bacterium]
MLQQWVAVDLVEGIGPVKLKKLLEEHGSIEQVCKNLAAPIDRAGELIKKAQEKNITIISQEDNCYPPLLKNIYDPPLNLYVKGDPSLLKKKAIAIVGTRRASHYGREIAKKLAFDLASLGLTVVSGLASGIDTAAHQGALEAGGKTLAVFGCGVDVIFPSANRVLARDIAASGALISEYPLEAPTSKSNFPRRNRIISGLSVGTIVIEGDYKSGAMITAKCAVDQGREVFAVPGDIRSDLSNGPHWLIKQGAKLVERVEDVVEELGMIMPERCEGSGVRGEETRLSADEQKIVACLSLEPKHIDFIALETKFPVAQVSGLLMILEVKKVVQQLPGKVFVVSSL